MNNIEAISAEEAERQNILDEAEKLALSYDYDTAIALLQSYTGYDTYEEMTAAITEYEETKASCVPVNIDEVTHIFYHSLVVDPIRCFGNQENDPQCIGNNQWMTTVSEFEKITQEMYNRGFVLVSIHDLYEFVIDENGNEIIQPATIMLPEGKKAFVLSIDDLSYYHSYDDYGYAAKLIIDENGKVRNEYIDADGNTLVGAYDVVPLLDDFIEAHPDASYRGAKGTIALTGYNGVLGYRTDISYETRHDINWDKQKWLEEHPDFDLETERTEAKRVADAMKEDGWTFASHTWGHKNVGETSLSVLQGDTRRWKENVEPIVGETNTIIFAHGTDLERGLGDYSLTNEKFQYYYSEGYRVFCNVDATKYATHFGTDYLRQGRRNLDGYRIYNNAIGEQDNLSDLFDAKTIIDPDRPPVPPL
ncbi:MAG: polysaccharide deacetylase [Agathobacter sp.]|nr:polysaccharide deacetylase [Agathobacter sp.]